MALYGCTMTHEWHITTIRPLRTDEWGARRTDYETQQRTGGCPRPQPCVEVSNRRLTCLLYSVSVEAGTRLAHMSSIPGFMIALTSAPK